ncbi:MAG TPA: drug/metabolite exporter YedA [Thermoanaerobaculia bacterium]|nr:drug/metabolite exporter YedA [Thermoanaerobaculia bacterium]
MPETTARSTAAAASLWRLAPALGAVYLIWGSTYLAIRFAIETIPPFLMAGARFLVAGVLLYVWARASGAARPTLAQWRATAAIGGFLLLGGNGGVVWAEQHVPSGIAALLITTEPLWIVLLDWLRPNGRRPGWRVAAGLLLGFAGTVLLVRPGLGGGVYPLGAIVLVLASLSWAWGSLRSTWAPLPSSRILTTGMQMLAGGALLLLVGLATGEPARFALAEVSTRSLLAVLYLVVFGSLIAFSAYVWLLREAPPALVATYAYVNPVVAVLLGWGLAGEPLTAGTLAAAAVIIAGVVVITTAPRHPAARPLPAREVASASPEERAAA